VGFRLGRAEFLGTWRQLNYRVEIDLMIKLIVAASLMMFAANASFAQAPAHHHHRHHHHHHHKHH